MELRQLKYFLAVVETEHFTRAAESVHISQPALSKQIKKLESELGTPLFDRHGRGVDLTQAGEVLVPHARRALAEVEGARVAVDELQGGRRGSLHVGTVQTAGAYLVPEIAARLTTEYPGIDLSIDERAAPDVDVGVAESRLDLGLGFVPASREEVETEELLAEELLLIASADHPLANREVVSVSTLSEYALVLLKEGFCTRRLIDETFEKAFGTPGSRPRIAVEMTSIAGILATVRATGTATILPRLTLRMPSGQGLAATKLDQPVPRRTLGLLFRAGAYRDAAMTAFAKTTRRVVDEET
jgi:LysR family cyn operon transcriptional activator